MDSNVTESTDDQSTGTQASANSLKGAFSDPVYKKLATLNGEVNRMTKDELKKKLESLHLDTRGQKDMLKKRLKNYLRHKQLGNIPGTTRVQRYEYLLVIDFEATCQKDVEHYHHEIIEFPVVLVDVTSKTIIDEFHSYVRPTLNPHLSEFCTELTGITQKMVDAAPHFTEVLSKMQEWLVSHKLGKSHKFAVVTDGPWDMSRFMYLQCRTSGLPFPRWARKWVNIRKSYCTAYRTERAKITTMLESLGLAFEGTLHSGIDDSRNIARIVVQMLRDNCNLRVNERLFSYKVSAVADAVHKAKHGKDAAYTPEIVGVGAHDRDESTDDDDDEDAENKEPCIAAVVGVVDNTMNVEIREKCAPDSDKEESESACRITESLMLKMKL